MLCYHDNRFVKSLYLCKLKVFGFGLLVGPNKIFKDVTLALKTGFIIFFDISKTTKQNAGLSDIAVANQIRVRTHFW